MTRRDFLEQLKAFTVDSTKDLLMPVRQQKGDPPQEMKPASVYLMRLPDSTSTAKKAPYIIHQVITGKDSQSTGEREASAAQVRSIFCVYNDNEEEGGLMLLELMERLRIDLLKTRVLASRYELDMESGVEYVIYPDDTAPYYMGEMASTWKMPAVQRELPVGLKW